MSKTILILTILFVVAVVLGGLIFALNQGSSSTNENTNTSTNTANQNARVGNTNTRTNSSAQNSNTSSANSNTNASATTEISITDEGFSPESLTVNAGQRVTWTNTDNIVHYVAPNDHPSHQRYAGVWDDDGSGRISPGETYSITISTPGTYRYHDHLDSSVIGTLIVE